jgi:CubicO group peptidase (beta-lactamase class C family)
MQPGGNEERTMKMLRNISFAFLALSCNAVFAADEKADEVTALFEHFNEGVQPGAAVMVIEDGGIVYSGGFGYADLEKRIPIDARSTFRLGSLTKQFTAMAIMALAEAGKLDYDDAVIDYIPQLTEYPGVTIRHLLTHTSGLPDYYDTIDTSGGMPVNADLPAELASMDGPVFAPGEKYEYSNPAYEMLPLIVEEVSGQTFAEFMSRHVFAPAGMDDSLFFDHTEPEIANRVYGYEPAAGGFSLDDYDELNYLVGSGSMYATLEDFFAWDQTLDSEAVVSASTLQDGFTRHTLNNGDEIDYGFGWRLDQRRGHRRIAHGGSWVGFRTSIAKYPDEKLTIVVLTNRTDGNPGTYVDRITDIYLPESGNSFRPADTAIAIRSHQRRVPNDDIWWTVTGEQMRWMHLNTEQLFPSVKVYRNGPVQELDYEVADEIANFQVDTPNGPEPFDDFLFGDQSTAMGVVIVHKGKIVYESYPRMQEHEQPIYWSVAKVIPATILRILEERGQLDVSKPIESYIPELATSAFAGITVRNILDMASGLDCQDEYEDRQSCYYRYSMAIGDGFRDENAPDNPYDFLKTLKVRKHAEQGTRFSYSGVNTFILAWLVEKITGHPFQDVVTKEIWYHIGAESDASYVAYRYGIPLTHGGFVSRMRDLARFGLLFTPSYQTVSEHRIISESHLELLRSGGNPQLRINANMPAVEESGIRHNVYQWDQIHANGTFYKGGWGGQGLIVNPDRDVVAVFTSYFKEDQSEMQLERAVFEVVNGVFGSAE